MLLLVTMPLFFFVGFLVKEKLVQHEMEEKLENNFLQTITVNISDIQRVKQNKEVIIFGKLFDIKSEIRNGNEITLTGLYDEEENKLREEFANIMHRKTGDSTPFDQFIIKFIFTSAIIRNPPIPLLLPFELIQTVYPFFNETIVSLHLSLNTPPPIV